LLTVVAGFVQEVLLRIFSLIIIDGSDPAL
jgi:hypothetical protein